VAATLAHGNHGIYHPRGTLCRCTESLNGFPYCP